ncbi:MAG: glycosyltransferase family 9 protein [Planctomycetota bacterium]
MTAVLVVRLSAMGDFVHGIAALQALHRARPDWQLAVLTQAANAPLLDGVAGIRRVHCFDRRGGLRAVARAARELRRERFDIALDFQGNWKSALLTRLSGARRRLGAAPRWRQEPASRVLLNETVALSGPNHPAAVAVALVRHVAAAAEPTPLHLLATTAEIARERAALTALGIDSERAFRVVVVTDAADPRALRPATIVHELRRGGLPTVLLQGPAERDPAPAGAPLLRHGPGEVRRLIALGNLVAAAGGEAVGPDQGASHVLVAAGAIVRMLYGAQDPACTAPAGAHVFVAPQPPACSPCRAPRCRHPEGPVCMAFTLDDARRLSAGGSSASP